MTNYTVEQIKQFLGENGYSWTGVIIDSTDGIDIIKASDDDLNRDRNNLWLVFYRDYQDKNGKNLIEQYTRYLYITDKVFRLYRDVAGKHGDHGYYEIEDDLSEQWKTFNRDLGK